MFVFYFVSCSFLLVQRAGTAASHPDGVIPLPPWISNDPAFQHPNETDSRGTGNGAIGARGKLHLGWLLHLNDRSGHGIEVRLDKLSLDPDAGDFLTLIPWPLTSSTTRIKLFTGTFQKPMKQLLIPNTKSFRVLYSSSRDSSEMALTYRRYGIALEETPPSTENPSKKKETVYEVQLKGRTPKEYFDPQFLIQFKEAVRSAARRYSLANQIPFNDTATTQEMVQLHRISFCPFEWPDRDVCASLEHSIFVSGVRVPGEELIKDYELSAEHLGDMWAGGDLSELQKLGITVFHLPQVSHTVLYWWLIIGFAAAFSLAGSFLFWKSNHQEEVRPRETSLGAKDVKKGRKTKLKLGKQERIPSFMYAEGNLAEAKEEVLAKEKFDDVLKTGDSTQLPIKSYFGSILFSSNRAFEEDEDGPTELRPTSPLK